MIRRFLALILLIFINMTFVSAQCPPPGGGVFVNEISAFGDEYIELVVVGDPTNPLDPVDLTGWIVDDNNIDATGQGTATGHLVFDATFSSVLPGAIIVIYDESFPYSPLPVTTPPYLYVLSGADMDGCSNVPNTGDSNYSPCSSGAGEWDYIGLRNAGDVVQARDPFGIYYHGLVYGAVTTTSPSPVAIGDGDMGLDCGNWFDGSNYISNETPGDFNTTDNQILILAIRNGSMDCNDIDLACSPMNECPEINGLSLTDIQFCENEELIATAFNIENMDFATNGETDFGINFVTFPGPVPPADPYVGGTSIGTVSFGSLMGVDPNLSASITVTEGTLAPGLYSICAILDPPAVATVCFPSQCSTIEVLDAPEVILDGVHDFCPDDCYTLEMSITGGVPPYDVDFVMSISGLPPFMQTQTSYDVNNQVTICYDGGLFPIYDAGTMTVHVPSFFTGSGTLKVTEVRTDNGCFGIIDDDLNILDINFLEAPSASIPSSYILCDDDTDGFMIFDLTTKDLEINGGSGDDVRYYEDLALTSEIIPANNYFSNTKTIFAVVEGANGCNSDVVQLDLIVEPAGNIFVDIFCTSLGQKSCEFCTSEDVTIDIIFDFGIPDSYTVEMEYGNVMNGFTTFTASNVIDLDMFPFTISESSTFRLLSVTRSGECPDVTGLGDDVEIIIIDGPNITNDLFQNGCDSVVLEDIVGDLSGGESYYTMPNGAGTAIAPGTVYYTSTTLYIYDAVDNCEDEITVSINIVDQVSFDPIAQVDACGYYILREIEGSNLTGNEAYFTAPNGVGIKYNAGDTIFSTIHLYVYDPITCLEEEIEFDITMGPGAVITYPIDTTVCNYYILETILGTGLDGSEFYNTAINASGDTLMVGDTIFDPQTIFIYVPTEGVCVVQDSFMVNMGTTNNVGQDSTLILCEGDVTLVDLWSALGSGIDTAGIWTDFFVTGVDLSDSTAVDFSTLVVGEYPFTYQLLDTTCGVPIALITIKVVANANAGNSSNISLCQTDNVPHDLEAEIGIADAGGVWSQEPAGIFDLSNINEVYYHTAPPGGGPYVIKYLVDPGGACLPDSATITISVSESVFAGADSLLTVCVGTIVELTDLVVGETSIGTFTDDDLSLGLTGSSFNSAGLIPGFYNFTHSVDAIAPCLSSTSLLTIEIVNGLTAGTSSTIQACVGDIIDLTDHLVGADAGGTFMDDDVSGFLNGNMVDVANNTNSSIDFTYTIGGGNCPVSTATITIDISPIPTMMMTLDDDILCAGECGNIIIDLIGSPLFEAKFQLLKNNTPILDPSKLTGANMINYTICHSDNNSFSNDTIYITGDFNWEFKILSLSDDFCDADTTGIEELTISLLEDEYVYIDTTSCMPVVIEGVTFDQTNTAQIIEIDDPLACKKIIDVTYHYTEPEFVDEITQPLCPEDDGVFTLTSLLGDPSEYTLVLDQVMLPIPSLPFSLFIPSGIHEVYIVHNDGCQSPVKTFIVDQGPDLVFTPTLDSLNADQYQFFGDIELDEYTVIWTPSDNLDCISCLDPVIDLLDVPMSYVLEIRYSASCVFTYIVNVPAKKMEPEPEPEPIDVNHIYIPNTFDPSQSHFYVTTKDQAIIELFQVYDRWGNLMYDEKNIDTNTTLGWDGYYKGQEVDPGVYVYVIKVNTGEEIKTMVGSLTLLR